MTDYSSEEFWKGAPEGATGYLPESGAWYAAWVKEAGNIFFTWLASGDTEWDEDDNFDELVKFMIRRPITPPWSGDGLPPVGSQVEYGVLIASVYPLDEWQEGDILEVLAHRTVGDKTMAVLFNARHQSASCLIDDYYRQVKTPAQIAAEEREKAIDEMYELTNTSSSPEVIRAQRNVCASLYDAGYRKGEDQ